MFLKNCTRLYFDIKLEYIHLYAEKYAWVNKGYMSWYFLSFFILIHFKCIKLTVDIQRHPHKIIFPLLLWITSPDYCSTISPIQLTCVSFQSHNVSIYYILYFLYITIIWFVNIVDVSELLYTDAGLCTFFMGGSIHIEVHLHVSGQHRVEEEEQDGGTRLQFLPYHI